MRAVLLMAVLGGCVMSSSTDGMRDAMREAHTEQQVHVTQSRAAADLPALVLEVDRHSAHMTAILDDMTGHMSSMHSCGGMGMMWNMRDEMQVEVDDHQTTMHRMSDFITARSQDEHHMVVMSDMLNSMDIQLDTMHCDGIW